MGKMCSYSQNDLFDFEVKIMAMEEVEVVQNENIKWSVILRVVPTVLI